MWCEGVSRGSLVRGAVKAIILTSLHLLFNSYKYFWNLSHLLLKTSPYTTENLSNILLKLLIHLWKHRIHTSENLSYILVKTSYILLKASHTFYWKPLKHSTDSLLHTFYWKPLTYKYKPLTHQLKASHTNWKSVSLTTENLSQRKLLKSYHTHILLRSFYTDYWNPITHTHYWNPFTQTTEILSHTHYWNPFTQTTENPWH